MCARSRSRDDVSCHARGDLLQLPHALGQRRGARAWTILVMVISVFGLAACSASSPVFLERTVEWDGIERRYQVYVPAGYRPSRSWPVILFLHGAGERGRDGVLQTEVGLGPVVRRHPAWFPALIVFPQAFEGETWHGEAGRVALTALRQTIEELNGDPARTYVVGLSMGGFGAWELAFEHPDLFAAVVSVSGGLFAPPPWDILDVPLEAEDPYAVVARRLHGMPVWLFHGSEDSAIPVSEARRLHVAFSRGGSPVRYTEYPGQAHRIWDEALAEPELWPWLFAQRRPGMRDVRSHHPP
jgi:predicted peptidase